jgi:response regulator of citrate/malate metabolism
LFIIFRNLGLLIWLPFFLDYRDALSDSKKINQKRINHYVFIHAHSSRAKQLATDLKSVTTLATTTLGSVEQMA